MTKYLQMSNNQSFVSWVRAGLFCFVVPCRCAFVLLTCVRHSRSCILDRFCFMSWPVRRLILTWICLQSTNQPLGQLSVKVLFPKKQQATVVMIVTLVPTAQNMSSWTSDCLHAQIYHRTLSPTLQYWIISMQNKQAEFHLNNRPGL